MGSNVIGIPADLVVEVEAAMRAIRELSRAETLLAAEDDNVSKHWRTIFHSFATFLLSQAVNPLRTSAIRAYLTLLREQHDL